ncbi:DUF1272 domain-containing protein [Tenacibaculum litopenaei]|jgi:hypothetical protein|uniref:DUF1272 domain-containing protein n=1 Tax=Tenacibaculum litopenaei TaxID=396016 RepID=UPI0038B68F47
MLSLKPNCEHCGTLLAYNATNAYICSFECTYCEHCALTVFENVCPSCTGNFSKRPIRPVKWLEKYPADTRILHQPKNITDTFKIQQTLKNTAPENR